MGRVRPLTEQMAAAIMRDEFPQSMGVLVDFGLDGWGGGDPQQRYEALYYPVRAGEISMDALDAALGDGPALTRLVNDCPSNPHKGIVFATVYDDMGPEEEEVT